MSKKPPRQIEIRRSLKLRPDGLYQSHVVKSGNGAVIPFFKRFIGQRVYIVLPDERTVEEVTELAQELG